MNKRKIGKIINQIAKDNGVTAEEVRRDIEDAIKIPMSSQNAIIQARWAAIPCKGEQPTVEELIAHLATKVQEKL